MVVIVVVCVFFFCHFASNCFDVGVVIHVGGVVAVVVVIAYGDVVVVVDVYILVVIVVICYIISVADVFIFCC